MTASHETYSPLPNLRTRSTAYLPHFLSDGIINPEKLQCPRLRPVPSSGCRMAPPNEEILVSTSNASSKRYGTSALPQPISGSSRRETSLQETKHRSYTPLCAPIKENRIQSNQPSTSLICLEVPDQFVYGHNLPRSQTTTSLSSNRHEIVSRRLLQPIQPPVPQPAAATTMETGRKVREARDNAIIRMTMPQSCSLQDLSRGKTKERLQPPEQGNKSPIILALSANDTANRNRITELQRKTPNERNVFINSKLARSSKQLCHSKSTRRLRCGNEVEKAIVHQCSGSDNDIRSEVYVSEPMSFWAGRYMAVHDRLRNAELEHTLHNNPDEGQFATLNSFGSTNEDVQYERTEQLRIASVLEELKQACKTNPAVESFFVFEKQFKNARNAAILKANEDSIDMLYNSSKRAKLARDVRTQMDKKPPSYITNASNKAANQVSVVNVHACHSKIPQRIHPTAMIKSKTMGSLPRELQGVSELDDPQFASTKYSRPVSHVSRYMGAVDCSSRAVHEGEKQVPTRASRAFRKVSERIFSSSSISSGYGSHTGLGSLTSSIGKRSNRKAHLNTDSSNICDATQADLDSFSLNKEKTKISELRNEQQPLRRSRKSDTRDGSDLVKKMVGAGIREVRKMSRRVGSLSMGVSSGDLSAMSKDCE